MTDETFEWVEFHRVADQIEGDLLAAFLEDDGDIEFQMLKNARSLGPLMPGASSPVIFRTHPEHLERARELLATYLEAQRRSIPPDPEHGEWEDPADAETADADAPAED